MENMTQEQITELILTKTAREVENVWNQATFENEVIKEAHEIIENATPETMEKLSAHIAWGQGFAHGEMMAKEAAYNEASIITYNNVMDKIAEHFGKEAADEVHDTLMNDTPVKTEDGAGEETKAPVTAPEKAELIEAIKAEAAVDMVNRAGGQEAVDNNPELAKQILVEAEAIGEKIVNEL